MMRWCLNAALIVALSTALSAMPVAAADPPYGPGPDSSDPVAQGHYTTADDPGWIFFKVDLGGGRAGEIVRPISCGIGPDGTVGCDAVPGSVQIGLEPPAFVPPGTNQTIATSDQPASYRYSDTTTFTRDVDFLPTGHQLMNGDARCHLGYQGTMTCTTGEHGFAHNANWGDIW